AWIDLTGSVLFLVPFAVLMFWISWGWVVRSWTILETSADPGGLPRYPIKAVVLVSFLLLLLQALSQIVKNAAILAEPVGGSARVDGPGSPSESGSPTETV
ncbi:MAG TPA: C4-dicarboxylate ABC transporter substrate-binding protein, partial [Gemmatimonadetes bacterium]|nr:C4-dicarboxylate ABC transporter substrate-binding protein [Gemmatimonadota bacterium]